MEKLTNNILNPSGDALAKASGKGKVLNAQEIKDSIGIDGEFSDTDFETLFKDTKDNGKKNISGKDILANIDSELDAIKTKLSDNPLMTVKDKNASEKLMEQEINLANNSKNQTSPRRLEIMKLMGDTSQDELNSQSTEVKVDVKPSEILNHQAKSKPLSDILNMPNVKESEVNTLLGKNTELLQKVPSEKLNSETQIIGPEKIVVHSDHKGIKSNSIEKGLQLGSSEKVVTQESSELENLLKTKPVDTESLEKEIKNITKKNNPYLQKEKSFFSTTKTNEAKATLVEPNFFNAGSKNNIIKAYDSKAQSLNNNLIQLQPASSQPLVQSSKVEMSQSSSQVTDASGITEGFGQQSIQLESSDGKNSSGFSSNAEVATLDLSNIDKTNRSELINKISNYIEQKTFSSKDTLDVVVKHAELGDFKIHVAKGDSVEQVKLDIQTLTKEGQKFFVDNELEIVKNLGKSGIKVLDFNITETTKLNIASNVDVKLGVGSSFLGSDDKGTFSNSNSNSGSNSSGSNTSQNSQGQSEQDKRKFLWEQAKEKFNEQLAS